MVVRELNEAISLEADYGYQSGTQVWGFLLGGTLFLGGLICLYMLQTSWIIGSRLDDLLTVTISRWLLPGKRSDGIRLTEYGSIEHSVTTVGSDHGTSATSNSVFVQAKSGSTLPLARGPMFTDQSTAEIKKIVHGWATCTRLPKTSKHADASQ